MRFGVARTLVLAVLASACALHGGRPAHSADGVTTAADPACAGQAPASRWREMTWAEYYLAVQNNAWRHGATVIWVEPPRVAKVPKAALRSNGAAAVCAR